LLPAFDLLATSFAGLRHAFEALSTFFVEDSKTWSRTSQQVRWFMRVLDKWNVEKKTRIELANKPVEAEFSLRILLLVLIMM